MGNILALVAVFLMALIGASVGTSLAFMARDRRKRRSLEDYDPYD